MSFPAWCKPETFTANNDVDPKLQTLRNAIIKALENALASKKHLIEIIAAGYDNTSCGGFTLDNFKKGNRLLRMELKRIGCVITYRHLYIIHEELTVNNFTLKYMFNDLDKDYYLNDLDPFGEMPKFINIYL